MENLNNRFRFRAWYKEKNRMVYFNLFSLIGSENGVMIENNIYSNIDNPKYTFMQYTGLNDKNGIEIAVGDIVTKEYGNGANIGTYSVGLGVFDFAECGFGITCLGFYLEEKYMPINRESIITDLKNLKILGNIYENPELLTN